MNQAAQTHTGTQRSGCRGAESGRKGREECGPGRAAGAFHLSRTPFGPLRFPGYGGTRGKREAGDAEGCSEKSPEKPPPLLLLWQGAALPLPCKRAMSPEEALLNLPGTVPEVGGRPGVGRRQECSGLLLVQASVPRGGPLDIKASFCPPPSGRAAGPLAMTQAWP